MHRISGISPHLFVILFLFVSTLVVFSGTSHHSFLTYDDADYVYENTLVQQGLTPAGLSWALVTTSNANWHPLAWISHMLDVSLFGMESGRHHLVNVIFHAANSILLFLLLLRLTGAMWRSAFVASLFALHPIHVESVAWVAERKDLLCTYFFLLTLLAYRWYVERPSAGRYAVIIVQFILALMSKPMAVTLPFVLLLLDYWPMERLTFSGTNPSAVKTGRPLPSPFRGILAEKIPLFLLSIASSAITMFAQRSSVDTVISMEAIPFPWRIANAFSSYAAYLGQTIWPSSLAVFYPHPKTHLALWNIGISVLLLAFISFHAVRERKRYPWLLFGWLWYLGMLVPVIGLVQVGGQARADRYTYLPLIGIFVIAAWGAKELARRYKIRSTVTAVAAGVVLTALASAAWIQTGYWKDSITLYSRALEVTEDNWAMQYNLGTELLNAGKNTEALVHLQEALKIYPGDANTNLNTGSALLGVGKTDEATRHFQRALNLRNNDYQTWMRVAGLYYRHGNTELAARCYEEVKRRFGSKIGSR